MNFSVNFMDRATVVLKEAFLLKKYKAMPLVLAIFVGIFMVPLALISAVCAALVYVLGYLFSVASQPVQNLHKLLHEEGQSVKHGTQVVVYLLSWGLVFGTYAALTFLLVTLTVLYSLFSIFTYLWTLGGFKFHVFAKEEDISVEVEGKYNILIPVIFVAGMAVLLLGVPSFYLLRDLIEIKFQIPFKLLPDAFLVELHETDNLRFFISILYSAIFFAPNPKKIAK